MNDKDPKVSKDSKVYKDTKDSKVYKDRRYLRAKMEVRKPR